MMGPSDVVYVEKRKSPRTDPWETPVTNLCALDTSLPNQIKSNHFYCHITTAQVPW